MARIQKAVRHNVQITPMITNYNPSIDAECQQQICEQLKAALLLLVSEKDWKVELVSEVEAVCSLCGVKWHNPHAPYCNCEMSDD